MKNLICSNCGTESVEDAKVGENWESKLVVAAEITTDTEVSEAAIAEAEKAEATSETKPEAVKVEPSTETTSMAEKTTEKGTGKRTFNKKVVIPCVAAVIIIAILLLFSGPKITGLTISYDGATDEGVVIDSKQNH